MQFKHEIEEEIDSVLELNQTSSSENFNVTHLRQAIKNSNKSSAPGPDCITVELMQNGGEQLFHCLTHLMQPSQDAIIVRKKVGKFILATGKEI